MPIQEVGRIYKLKQNHTLTDNSNSGADGLMLAATSSYSTTLYEDK